MLPPKIYKLTLSISYKFKSSLVKLITKKQTIQTKIYKQISKKKYRINKKVKFVRVPKFEEVPYPVVMEPNLVIEYYSR